MVMKKFLCLLLAVGTIAAFSSCKKTCNCDVWLYGEMMNYPELEKPKDLRKCSDYNTVVDDPILGKSGTVCY